LNDPREEAPSAKAKTRNWVIIWLILLAIPIVPFAVLVIAGRDPFQLWAESVQGRGTAAAAVCFILLCADVLLPVPSSFVAVVSGQALGTAAGGILNWCGFTLGHAIGFLLSRAWGRPAARRFVGDEGLRRAGESWRGGATVAIILSRPIPVLAEAMSMFAGLTEFSFGRFAATIAVANIPHSFIYSWAGARVKDLASLNLLVAAGVGLPAAAYLLFMLARRR
jgi:uncharacterized membrane protein YdjX (TVP38/TMEM64 family)